MHLQAFVSRGLLMVTALLSFVAFPQLGVTGSVVSASD